MRIPFFSNLFSTAQAQAAEVSVDGTPGADPTTLEVSEEGGSGGTVTQSVNPLVNQPEANSIPPGASVEGASGTAASVVTAVGTFLAKVGNIVVAHPCVFVATTAGVLLMIYTVRRISKLKAKLANVENELEEVSVNLANAEHVQAYLEAKLANVENELEEVSENLANAKHAKKHLEANLASAEHVQEYLEAKLAKANELIENARHGARMQRV